MEQPSSLENKRFGWPFCPMRIEKQTLVEDVGDAGGLERCRIQDMVEKTWKEPDEKINRLMDIDTDSPWTHSP